MYGIGRRLHLGRDVFEVGTHSLKTGIQFSYEQVNVNPNPTFNGSFAFFGTESGLDFADFLIGVASNYNQADSQTFYGRHKYAAGFLQDTWRVKPSVTLNYGVRWDLMQYWSEKFNQIPTFVLGQQSKVYPTAPASLRFMCAGWIPARRRRLPICSRRPRASPGRQTGSGYPTPRAYRASLPGLCACRTSPWEPGGRTPPSS